MRRRECIIKTDQIGCGGIDRIQLAVDSVGCCERGDKCSGYIKDGTLFYYLSHCQLLRDSGCMQLVSTNATEVHTNIW